MLIGDERILRSVDVVAYGGSRKKLHKIFEADEEYAIFLVRAVDLLTSFDCPF